MAYSNEVMLAASFNLVYASMTSFLVPSNEEHLHLGLAVLHATQIRIFSQAAHNDIETMERYQSLKAIHLSFEQMHRGIYQRSRAITGPVLQRTTNRDC